MGIIGILLDDPLVVTGIALHLLLVLGSGGLLAADWVADLRGR